MSGTNLACPRCGTQCNPCFVIAIDTWRCWSWNFESSGCRPLKKLGGLSGDGSGKASASGQGHYQHRVSECLSVIEDCATRLRDLGVEVRPVGFEEEREPSEGHGWQKVHSRSCGRNSRQPREQWSGHKVVLSLQCGLQQCQQFRVKLLRRNALASLSP